MMVEAFSFMKRVEARRPCSGTLLCIACDIRASNKVTYADNKEEGKPYNAHWHPIDEKHSMRPCNVDCKYCLGIQAQFGCDLECEGRAYFCSSC
jgi:hypothetical protein